jgi:hypothetical protein
MGAAEGSTVGWGILIVTIFGLFCAFVILQATFAQRSWKRLVKQGDRWAIKALIDEEIDHWRRMRVPKGQSATLWRGLGTAEVASDGADYVNMIARAEGEYRIVEGVQKEVSSPLDEGIALAAALLERVFYDIPNVRPRIVRVDIYTSFRGEDGAQTQRCILTVTADRAIADPLPWDDLRSVEILSRFNTRYRRGERSAALPLDPGPPLSDDDDPDGGPPNDADARDAVDAAERLLARRGRDEGGDAPQS